MVGLNHHGFDKIRSAVAVVAGMNQIFYEYKDFTLTCEFLYTANWASVLLALHRLTHFIRMMKTKNWLILSLGSIVEVLQQLNVYLKIPCSIQLDCHNIENFMSNCDHTGNEQKSVGIVPCVNDNYGLKW